MTDLIRSAGLSITRGRPFGRARPPRDAAQGQAAGRPASTSPDLRIAVAGLRRLLEASAAAAGVDDFGLRMAERGGLANFGPVALVVREQARSATAIEALSRFIHIHHEGMRLKIERDEEAVMIAVTLRGGRPPRPAPIDRNGARHPRTASSARCSATTGGRSTFI